KIYVLGLFVYWVIWRNSLKWANAFGRWRTLSGRAPRRRIRRGLLSSGSRVGGVVVERLTMRNLLSIPLAALMFGLLAADRPAEAASYAGAASTRCCPVDQECAGHIEYQLKRCTVLRPVQETVYENRPITVERDVCETVMQPRTVTCMQTVQQCGV